MIESLEDIAAELYGRPLDEFVAARNERAKVVADDDLAAGVKALRKPLAPAWVVNLFARERPDQLAQALELGESLREAQEELDAKTLTALTRQRRTLVAELARAAADLAEHSGAHVTAATTEAVEQTLNAAMLDAGAADAVASGRLIRPLAPSGGDAVDLVDAVAGAVSPRSVRVTPPDELEQRRARKAAEQAVRSAEQQFAKSERLLSDVGGERDKAATRLDELRRQETELVSELERVRRDIRKAHEAVEDGDERLRSAEREVDAARSALDEARARVAD
ncbi:transposase [Microbacterium sp. NPDC056234]|uniref:transposase n=1 Tax=Microbacterium sp. NPDC056234 TaxID=3345757 RepID=UPI0035D64F2C